MVTVPNGPADSSLKQALRALRALRSKIDSLERARHEPIAIVGMGLRMGHDCDSPASLWSMLLAGTDATCELPPGRWPRAEFYDPDPKAPNRTHVDRGGYLRDVEGLDAEFFRMSPREALKLDPQQRLALECTWEAIEDAGLPAEALVGSDTGVFFAAGPSEYAHRLRESGLSGSDGYTLTGNLSCTLSGRLAFVLGSRGPTLTVDTGCSSSLVAVHLAMRSLREGESTLAVAGGVNLIASPHTTIELCKTNALGADGRCRTFDATAGGYSRAEGCGVLVLKRLSDAVAAGDRIWAVLRGSAVNHDGRSGGLTVPSGPAQQALHEKALRDAGVAARDVGFIECHGTGTPLGDPIEVGALAAVYGRLEGRPECVLGALKTNLGHLELAAGVAGLIKAACCVRLGQIPPNLHLDTPNPMLPLGGTAFTLPRTTRDWPEGYASRIAAVSSFGVGGTNAHVIVEAPPTPEPSPSSAIHPGTVALVLSARSHDALRAQAERHAELLASPEAPSLVDVAHSLRRHRTAFDLRLALAASEHDKAVAMLREVARGRTPKEVTLARAQATRRLVFVFGGHGSQWTGMGRRAMATDPVFRRTLDACEVALSRHVDWSLVEQLEVSESAASHTSSDVMQPMIFAIQVAFAAAFEARGVVPDMVVGNSMGEVAAAHVAGGLSLEDAAMVICTRSRLASRASPTRGAMALVAMSAAELASRIRAEPALAVAVHQTATQSVLSGEESALTRVVDTLASEGIWTKRVSVDFASHSPLVDPIRPMLFDRLAAIEPRPCRIPFFSTVTGARLDRPLDANYWADNLRQPVRFAESIEALGEDGFDLFVEIGPHPVLLSAIRDNLANVGRDGVAIASAWRSVPEDEAFVAALGGLYAAGWPVAPEHLGPPGRRVELPTYPWQRQRFWVDPPQRGTSQQAAMPSPKTAVTDRLITRLHALPEADRPRVLADHLAAQVADTLGEGEGARAPIADDADWFDRGLDSMMALDLAARLSDDLDRPIAASMVLRHASVRRFIAALGDILPPLAREPSTPASNPWLVWWTRPSNVALRVFAFPYAGGGASLYRPFGQSVPDGVELVAVRTPGRESRVDETPLTEVAAVAALAAEAILPHTNRPYALLGYSLGGLHAYEVALQLEKLGAPAPQAFLVAACPAPSALPVRVAPTDAELIAFLEGHGLADPALLSDPALRSAVLRTLRADSQQYATYEPTDARRLVCPVVAFASQYDTIAPLPLVAAWTAHGMTDLSLEQLPGGHFFIHSHPEETFEAMRRHLESFLGSPDRNP